MMKTNRFFTRIAGILIFALPLTPGTLAEDAASVDAASVSPSAEEPALVVAAADGLMNVAVYDALKSAGVDEKKARAAARSVAFPEQDQLATKADLVALQAVNKADLAALRAVTKADLKAGLAEMEARLIWAGAGAMGLILTLLVGLFAMIVGVWRKIADLAEKMPPPVPAH